MNSPSFYQTSSAEQAISADAAIACSPVRMRSRRLVPTEVHDATTRRPGKRIAMFTLLEPVGRGGSWLLRCDCGTERVVRMRSVETGHTSSCGCFARQATRDRHRKHGHGTSSKTPTYQSWQHMRSRCANPDDANYGGRGITVCAAWASSFSQFLSDMGERPPGTSLDRIDNSRGYEPGNCRWATQAVQATNSRRCKLTPHTARQLMELKGSMSQRKAGALFGVSSHTVRAVWAGKAWRAHVTA